MIMEILLTILITWFLIYNIFYSPRARVRILLRQMFNIPIKLARERRKLDYKENYLQSICEEALQLRYKLLMSLLNFYFDAENDKEYIEEKKGFAEAYLDAIPDIFKKDKKI